MNDRVLQMSPQMSFRVDVSSQRNNDHALRALMCAVACSAVLTACKTISSATGAAGEAVANVLLPVSQENQMGVQLVKEVEKESKIHADKDVQDYVANLGKNIAAQAHDVPAGIKFTFKVIDDPKTVNAFALPGGHIYVYSGLMKLADDEAELASVIGHEIAHVTQRHVAERLVAAHGLDAILSVALGTNPGLLGQLAAGVISNGSLMKFTRDQEADADAKGLPYATRAGYDPSGFVRLFTKLKKGEGPAFLVFLQDHPLPSQRIDAARAEIKRLKHPPETTNAAAYATIKAKL